MPTNSRPRNASIFSARDTRMPFRLSTLANSIRRSCMSKSPAGDLVQVVSVTSCRHAALGLFFRQVGFEFLMRFANIGLVLDQGGKRLFDKLLIELLDIEQGQGAHPIEQIGRASCRERV